MNQSCQGFCSRFFWWDCNRTAPLRLQSFHDDPPLSSGWLRCVPWEPGCIAITRRLEPPWLCGDPGSPKNGRQKGEIGTERPSCVPYKKGMCFFSWGCDLVGRFSGCFVHVFFTVKIDIFLKNWMFCERSSCDPQHYLIT